MSAHTTGTYANRQPGRSANAFHWLSRALLLMIAAAHQRWHAHRTRRAVMELEAWQRADCGIDRPDVPTRCQCEAAARRKLSLGMPTDWC